MPSTFSGWCFAESDAHRCLPPCAFHHHVAEPAPLWIMSHCGDVGRDLGTPSISPGETRPANRERLPRLHVSASPADHRRAAPHLLPRRAPVILKIGIRQPSRSATRGSAAHGTTDRRQPRSSRQLRDTASSDTLRDNCMPCSAWQLSPVQGIVTASLEQEPVPGSIISGRHFSNQVVSKNR
jgi:hypothetical protein